MVRARIRAIPDDTYESSVALDGDGVSDDVLPIAIKIIVEDDAIIADYSNMPAQVAGCINAGYFGGWTDHRARGIKPAPSGRVTVIKPSGERTRLYKTKAYPVAPGDLVIMEVGGGGGYGPPERRPRDAVRGDVQAGYRIIRHGRVDVRPQKQHRGPPLAQHTEWLTRSLSHCREYGFAFGLSATGASADPVADFYREQTATLVIGSLKAGACDLGGRS